MVRRIPEKCFEVVEFDLADKTLESQIPVSESNILMPTPNLCHKDLYFISFTSLLECKIKFQATFHSYTHIYIYKNKRKETTSLRVAASPIKSLSKGNQGQERAIFENYSLRINKITSTLRSWMIHATRSRNKYQRSQRFQEFSQFSDTRRIFFSREYRKTSARICQLFDHSDVMIV